MSSSRVIKPGEGTTQVNGFNFQAIQRDGSRQTDKTDTFVRLDLFDASELSNASLSTPQSQADAPISPPAQGVFISDEDLQRYQEESYQRGLQDGKNLAERGLLNVFRGLRTAAEALQILREKVLRDSEDDLLALSLSIARKVIAREVVQDRQTVLRLIRSSLLKLNEKDELIIRVHPDDHALLVTSHSKELKSELASVKFTLKADPMVEIGSCQIETERGTVDAGFEAQLDEIYRRLLEERAETAVVPETVE